MQQFLDGGADKSRPHSSSRIDTALETGLLFIYIDPESGPKDCPADMEKDQLLVHLTPSRTYRIVCPQCQHVTEGHANDLPADSSNSFVVDCSCGHSFKVLLNRRAHYRKPTRLSGEVMLVQGGRTIGEVCSVLDLSNTGMRLRARFLENMHEGQPITVTVTLDDSPRTRLPLPCVVRWIKLRQKQATMGAQFGTLDPSQLQALGFYLL